MRDFFKDFVLSFLWFLNFILFDFVRNWFVSLCKNVFLGFFWMFIFGIDVVLVFFGIFDLFSFIVVFGIFEFRVLIIFFVRDVRELLNIVFFLLKDDNRVLVE